MTFCGRFAIGSAQPEGVQDLVGSSDFLKVPNKLVCCCKNHKNADQRPFRCSFAPARPSETEQLLEITPDKERSKLMQLINHQFADPSLARRIYSRTAPSFTSQAFTERSQCPLRSSVASVEFPRTRFPRLTMRTRLELVPEFMEPRDVTV
ncbi:hypothetical protein T4A_3385 [Trichinella pseudospiralis]|uniref:Uncharacterized protein n=1 Tax=Trichinella pseudospiralis TaxID=6337 RepID=A0A0V1ERF6_TRIPS|nr:hypothetical protein T4A_3385 [Trichinella pseudospiralis]